MAESVVSAAAEHIASMISREHSVLSDMTAELEKLEADFRKMADFLGKAERWQSYDEQVSVWLSELRKIAYKAEDLVDTFVLKSESPFRLRRVRKGTMKLCKLREDMQVIKSKLDAYGEGEPNSPSRRRLMARGSHQASTRHLQTDNDHVVGIDKDVEQLVDLLTTESSVDVLAIVGMGGSGKTTLAWNIYIHQDIEKEFRCKAWVHLSPRWDASALLFDILRQINGKSVTNNVSLDALRKRFRSALKGKRSLVVLDDAWGLEPLGEIELLRGFDIKVIITSRHHVPPQSSLKIKSYVKNCLSEENSWELFNKFAGSKNGIDSAFHVLAKGMLKKCQGLPLAIVALGKVLKNKDSIQDWERMFSLMHSSDGASLYQPLNNILALSFDELPYYLKPCFLYMGLFPEASDFSAGTLTHMWIAEGFVQVLSEDETLEVAARRLLQELVDHTMVQVVRKNYAGKIKTLRMHEIMRDTCIMKAKELDFLAIHSSNSMFKRTNSRRAAINMSCSMPPAIPDCNSHLRSMMLYGPSSCNLDFDRLSTKGNHVTLSLAPLFQNFKLLRVLVISGIETVNGSLPAQVGKLIHLRYLRIRSTNIRELPKAIGNLRNLLTFDYWDVSVNSEIILPNVLYKLRRLRHLYLPNEMSITSRTNGELKLPNSNTLQTLWGVRGGEWMLNKMKDLIGSLSKLYIQGISSSEHLDAVFDCKTSRLTTLALDWYDFQLKTQTSLGSNFESLHKLRLVGKASSDRLVPLKFYDRLQKLELYYTQLRNPETMVCIGQLRELMSLKLAKDSYMGTEWTCNEGSFPKLEELKIANLRDLANWKIVKESVSCLKKLSIVSCLHLSPEGLQHITALEKLEIEHMPLSFSSNAKKLLGEDRKRIPCVVRIRDACAPSL